MPQTRRNLLLGLGGAVTLLTMGRLVPGVEAQHPIPSPNAPNPNYPPGMDGPPATKDSEERPVDPRKQQEIKADVERMYEMVSDLKKEVETTDTRQTLSVGMVKRAQEIEKLAKQVKNLAKS